jgi:hypothetical protein
VTTEEALGAIEATINYLALILDASGEACLVEQLERVGQFLRTGSS